METDTNVKNDDDVVSEDYVSGQHQIEQQPTHSRTVPENTLTGGACKYVGEVWRSNEDDSTNDSNSKFDDEEKCEKVYTESDIKKIQLQHTFEMDKLRHEMDTQKRHLERQLRDDRNEFEREKKAIEESTNSRVRKIQLVKKLEQEHREKCLIREKEDVERKLLHAKEDVERKLLQAKEVNERKLEECHLEYQEKLDKQVQHEKELVEMVKRLEELNFTEKFEIMTRAATKERELLRSKLQTEEQERKVLENEVEIMRQKIEVLQLGNSEDETVSRKRRRVEDVLTMSEQQGISKLESVVVIRLLNGDICTLRRQLKSLAKVLHQKRQEIQAFECWFVTDNAVKDYDYCKKTLSDNMKFVTFKNNQIKTFDNNIEIVARTLYDHLKSMGTIEADVSVLRRFYEEDASADHVTSPLMDNCNENEPTLQVLLGKVYTIITNQYNELVTKEKSKNKSK